METIIIGLEAVAKAKAASLHDIADYRLADRPRNWSKIGKFLFDRHIDMPSIAVPNRRGYSK